MSAGESLINWYDKNRRMLPWREDKNPFKIWLSEIILQQTRVDQGIPYYMKFIEKFPDIYSLALSHEQDVLKLWEGLGYYSRARNMLKAAKQVCEEFNGQFPADYNQLLKLKGVGQYTAAAIASIAFDLPHAVVDGNVQRVISRYYNVKDAVDSSKGIKIIRALAQELLVSGNSGKYNQSIMELGAMICKPAQPNCLQCPINYTCLAFERNNALQFPVKQKKAKQKKRFMAYIIFIYKNTVLLQQRPSGDIWEGLWEPFLIEKESLNELNMPNINIINDKNLTKILISKLFIHHLTHQKLHVKFHIYKVKNIKEINFIYQEVAFSQLEKKPFPILIKKFLKSVEFKEVISKYTES
jgi:A/G-specific adenine glycosylase